MQRGGVRTVSTYLDTARVKPRGVRSNALLPLSSILPVGPRSTAGARCRSTGNGNVT
jgi:hypothetical protein